MVQAVWHVKFVRPTFECLRSGKGNISLLKYIFVGQEQTENNRRLLLVHVVKINECFFLHNIICS